MALCLHHVGIRTRIAKKVIKKFTELFHFKVTAARNSEDVNQWVLRSGILRILVTETSHKVADVTVPTSSSARDSAGECQTACLYSEHFLQYLSTSSQLFASDSVFDIAIRVKNVEKCVERIASRTSSATILQEPTVIRDANGYVNFAIVKSCVGDVIHTLVDDKNYQGQFLPGFTPVPSGKESVDKTGSEVLSHVDHITFALPKQTSEDVMDWYAKCFGTERFHINNEETEDGFFVQGQDVGLRLLAMQYWRCAESGFNFPHTEDSLKIVLAEALPGQGSNQVDTFIEAHGGAGVQHIGLHTDHMVPAMAQLKRNGVEFLVPPPTYYTEIGKLDDISIVGESLDPLRNCGILIDYEKDSDSSDKRYLLQSFTKPLFDRETFFLEVIQRHGATGFGAGNITALWRAVQAYMDELNRNKQMKENSV